ncbi:hypothetical protein B0H14DRAFT_3668199 [Mycena olivaceomarginata]|nr:hypothetical protein B0H14DRAFT_3668199 [Mycena olivaceomarginata]
MSTIFASPIHTGHTHPRCLNAAYLPTIDNVLALALSIKVKMATGVQLGMAKETGKRLSLNDHMCPTQVAKDANGKHASLDEMIMDVDGCCGYVPQAHVTVPVTPSLANVGTAVEGATDAANTILTKLGLSTIIYTICGSRVIFQHVRNYSIYTYAVAICIVVCFAILALAYAVACGLYFTLLTVGFVIIL